MHIHFVCSGNTFRSRLAEAYLKSKKIKGFDVSSSGVRAHENRNGPITWYGARLMKRHALVSYMSNSWTHTTPKQLQDADIVIFMDKKHHHHSRRDLGFTGKRYQIWNIPDLDDLGFHGETSNKEEEERNRMRASEQVYQKIKHKVDAFASTFKK